MDERVRIGIIGLGRAGAIHLDAIRLLSGAHVAAICDASDQVRQNASNDGYAVYADLDEMLANADLEAAIICTPPSDHAATAVRCLQRGLHVLCEKPLALSTGDVLTMLQTANQHRRKLLVASKFRHVPEITRARAIIDSGEIGDPVTFEISFCSSVDMTGRWNSQRNKAGGGVIIDNGCHGFDIISFLFGSIRRVHATRLRSLQSIGVEDSATILVWAGDDVIGKVDLSWSIATPRDSYLVVHGSRGSVQVGWKTSGVQLASQPWQAMGAPYDKIAAHRAMLERFALAVRNGHESWISTAECLQTVAAVDAAYRSLESGSTEWVSIQGMRELSLVSRSTRGDDPETQRAPEMTTERPRPPFLV
jgi:predicted dehydrogenase